MRSLDRKLFRSLWNLKGPVLAIALVMSSGTATFVMSLSTLDSLRLTQQIFYRDFHFAGVFVSLKRAPEQLRRRIAEIPGVRGVETRVVAPVNLDIAGYPDPVTGLLISIPDDGRPLHNQLYLREGRAIESARGDEIIISEAFAGAHGFRPGDRLTIVINGRRQTLRIAGTALSPEYIFQIRPGDFIPDFASFGVLWMARTPLANAYDMEGAFNSATLDLTADARLEDVIERLDNLLARYGGLGAIGRRDQVSHRYLSEEFRQLEQMATIYPVIFLGVAAFLLNVVISRLVRTEREQIGILKAFGYGNGMILGHYLKLVGVIVLLGAGGGVAAGVWFGQGLSAMYMTFYRFPFLIYHLRPVVALSAVLICAVAALLGTLYSVRQAAVLPPAEAMRPEPPPTFKETLLERLAAGRRLSQPARMILRNIRRRPFRSTLATLGIAFSCAILMLGFFFQDALDYMIRVQFGLSQRDDLTVSFVEPTSRKAVYELQRLPGVQYVEAFRTVPARLRFENRTFRTAIVGLGTDTDLYRPLDANLRPIQLPPSGLVLTDYLAEILNVKVGDRLQVEVLEGSRPLREVTVSGLTSQFVGLSAWMRIDALDRLLGEGPALSGAYLSVDPASRNEVYSRLKEMPRVAGTVVREKMLESLRETMARQMLTFAFFITLFAATIAFGVVYNSARISLAERTWELATLRVLGFTRAEISYILLGELAVFTVAAIPAGFLIGMGLCRYLIDQTETELFRIPLVLEPGTFAFAATVVLISAAISGLTVRRRLDRLDLVAVLKTRE